MSAGLIAGSTAKTRDTRQNKVLLKTSGRCSRLSGLQDHPRMAGLAPAIASCAGPHLFQTLRIADAPGFVDLVAAKAKVGGSGLSVDVLNAREIVPEPRHFPPLLRGVVFIRKPLLGALSEFPQSEDGQPPGASPPAEDRRRDRTRKAARQLRVFEGTARWPFRRHSLTAETQSFQSTSASALAVSASLSPASFACVSAPT